MLTGDNERVAARIANLTGVDEFHANLLPQDKLALIDDLGAEGRKVLMVGDGLNDGPALAAAHASIAPGSASDASRQASDAVFLGDSLLPVAFTVRAARRTRGL